MHVRADVGVPLLQITVGARVDRRIDQRLRVPRQHQLLGRPGHFRMRDRNREHGSVMRLGDQRLCRRYPRRNAFVNEPADRRANRQNTAQGSSPTPHPAARCAVLARRFVPCSLPKLFEFVYLHQSLFR